MASWGRARAIAETIGWAMAAGLGVYVVGTGDDIVTVGTGVALAVLGAYWLRLWLRHLNQGAPRPLSLRDSTRLFRREERRRLGREAIVRRLEPGESIELVDRVAVGSWGRRSAWAALTNRRVLVVPFAQATLETREPVVDISRGSVRVDPIMNETSGFTTLGLRRPDDSRVQVNFFRDARDMAEQFRAALTASGR